MRVLVAGLPLRETKVPASSFDRMVRLSRDAVPVLVEELQPEEQR
jgi:hypothetical protein